MSTADRPRARRPGSLLPMSLTLVLDEAAHRLAARARVLAERVDGGDEAAWGEYIELVGAMVALAAEIRPGRHGEPLTTAEMAHRLGVEPKSLRRMVAEHRIAPAFRAGRLVRWSGTERPTGPARPRGAQRAVNRGPGAAGGKRLAIALRKVP